MGSTVFQLFDAAQFEIQEGSDLFYFTSCKNSLKETEYLNKIENSDTLRSIIGGLPDLAMTKKARKAQHIIEDIKREDTIGDIAVLVEAKATLSSEQCLITSIRTVVVRTESTQEPNQE